jgi:hypothetical protein
MPGGTVRRFIYVEPEDWRRILAAAAPEGVIVIASEAEEAD